MCCCCVVCVCVCSSCVLFVTHCDVGWFVVVCVCVYLWLCVVIV